MATKTLPADVCVFGYFGRLSPDALHSADCWFDSRLRGWIHGSSFVTYLRKTLFCSVETVANNALNHRRVIVFDRLWTNSAATLNTAFTLTNIHAKWWINCLLISSTPLLSHATSIYNRSKCVCGDFWCFPRQLPNLGDLSIQYHLCLYECI